MENPNDCWEFIYRKITLELDRMCPLEKRKVRQSNKPCLTNEILEAIYDKDQAWKLAKVTKDPNDLAIARRLRNNVKDIIRRAKRDFIQEKLVRDTTATKQNWNKQHVEDPDRNTATHKLFRKMQKSKLNTLLPYV